jgi:DNA-binding response OmpR family regulator
MPCILIVGSEPGLADAVERCLRHDGYAVSVVTMHGAALTAIDRVRPDLIVLDLLPGTNGIDLCRRMRARIGAPIFVLAQKAPGLDELLDCGVSVDDYLTKPLRPRELTARVGALLRRGPSQARGHCAALVVGDLRINAATRSIDNRPQPAKLTPKEFELLRFLAAHPGQIFSREQLLYNVWDSGSWADPSTITIHIRRLRQKIEPNAANPRYLKTVWGAGYTFEP